MTTPFDISIWRRASLKAEQDMEQLRLTVLDQVWHSVDQMSRTYKWEELYVFGSVIQSGRFNAQSDIDIGIQGLDKFKHFQLVADLSGLMEREVDVVRLEDCTFADVIRTRGIRWKKEK